MKKLVISLFMLLVVVFIFLPSETKACSCVGGQTVQQEIESSDVVFSGTVISIEETRFSLKKLVISIFKRVEEPNRKVEFEVNEYWKGAPSKVVIIQTGLGDGDCGYPFVNGKEYLVYAIYDENKNLTTGICDLTKELRDANEDLKILSEGNAPNNEIESSSNNKFLSIIFFIVIIVITPLAIIKLLRRKK